jgi:hypothetical protein
MEQPPRQGLGQFFRALVEFLDRRGLRGRVRAAVSEETRKLIDHPPRAFGFIPSKPIDEVEAALQSIAGNDALVECGLACARPLGWSLLQPILKMAFTLFGRSPEPVFSNLDRFFAMVTRGISFSWQSTEKGGTVLARFSGEATPEAAFHVLRGTLLFAYEACGTSGEVGPPATVESSVAGTTVRYDVRWK